MERFEKYIFYYVMWLAMILRYYYFFYTTNIFQMVTFTISKSKLILKLNFYYLFYK